MWSGQAHLKTACRHWIGQGLGLMLSTGRQAAGLPRPMGLIPAMMEKWRNVQHQKRKVFLELVKNLNL